MSKQRPSGLPELTRQQIRNNQAPNGTKPPLVLVAGDFCWVLVFEEEWPNANVIEGQVIAVDLTGRSYIVRLNGRSRSCAAERTFATREAAEAEKLIQVTINWSCYEATSTEAKSTNGSATSMY